MSRMAGLSIAGAAVVLTCGPVHATFHFMQIEQVIAGVNGDTTAQAIQLRMRTPNQEAVQGGRLKAFDAAGLNPVLLIDLTTPVAVGGTGARVLIATARFAAYMNPTITPDFIMTAPIPASYLAAGRLTWEGDPPFPTIYWSLSWGGSAYTGSTIGSTANDADGNFGPSIATAAPSGSTSAVKFSGPATALSTNNLADYTIRSTAAVFTNNAGASTTVIVPAPPCPTDLNHDCTTNGLDLGSFLAGWTGSASYAPCPPFAAADLNHDCKVNGLDLPILLAAWGPCPLPCP